MSLALVQDRLRDALLASGRAPDAVTLVAVSKEQPPERVAPVLAAGQRVFGENRVGEAQGRWAGALGVELHLVGPLQTNKARAAVELFSVIHSVDRPRLVDALDRLAQERGASPDLLLQVNTGGEPQKAGCAPDEAADLLSRARTCPCGASCACRPWTRTPRRTSASCGRSARTWGCPGCPWA
jgi:uncharacterized pyridoxal phosphate-containing UPF0001 family protein